MALVAGRKHCTCRWHDGPTWLLAMFFQPVRRSAEGEVTKLHSWCTTCQVRDQKLREHVGAMSPERLTKRREYWRFRYDKEARRAGVPVRKMERKVPRPAHNKEDLKLPIEPIANWLRERGIVTLPGIDRRILSRTREETHPSITLDLADRICVAADEPWVLHELYPED